MAKKIDQKSKEEYRDFVIKHLSAIIPVLQRVALGDFTERIKVSQEEDDFTELLVAINLTIEDLQSAEEEKKEIVRALRALSERQQALLVAIPDIVMEVDKNKVYRWANQAGIEFFGKDVVGKEAAFYFEGKQKTYELVEPLFHGKGDVFYVESWQRRKDGEKRLLAWWCRVLKDDRGNVTGALSAAHDITMAKKAQKEIKRHARGLERVKTALLNVMEDLDGEKAELERVKAKDEAILSCIGEGLLVVDLEGKVILTNRAFEDLLGWKLAEIQGKSFVDLVPAQDSEGNSIPPDKSPISIAITTGKETAKSSTGPDYFLVRKDKTRIPIAYQVTSVILNGKTAGAVGVFRDITEEKEIDRAKTEFVSLASHQLRTPLGIAKWYLEALKDNVYFKNAPKTISGYLNEVQRSNERLISLVRDLLSVSRIDQRRIRNNPQSTDILQLMRTIIKEADIISRQKNIKINLKIKQSKIPTIAIDPFRFHEVIENLIMNAVEYNMLPGSIEVIVDRQSAKKKTDDMLLISVKDTGIGLSEKDQKRLFTKFFRSEKAVSRNPDGSGLGLYVVKSYVEAWGGKVFVTSREGKGSTFTITIPLNPPEATAKLVGRR